MVDGREHEAEQRIRAAMALEACWSTHSQESGAFPAMGNLGILSCPWYRMERNFREPSYSHRQTLNAAVAKTARGHNGRRSLAS